jgi:hypothetical protein
VSATAPVKNCTPATFSAVLGAAVPGDVLLCGPGSYGGITINKDGQAGLPLVIRGQTNATFSSISLNGRKHVYVENATVSGGSNCIDLNGTENCVVRRCTVTFTGSPGIGAKNNPGAKNCYVSDNIVTGPNAFSYNTMYPNSKGEGIEMTGPGNVICYNRVRNCHDNISTMEPGYDQYCVDIYNNDLSAAGDDGIEADYCKGNCRIMRNRISNAFVGLSSQPGLGGPTYFIRNVMYNLATTSFKFHCYSQGDVVLHNTVVRSGAGMVCYAGEEFDFACFRNNLCIGGPSDSAVVAKQSWADWGSGAPAWIHAAGPHCTFDYDALGAHMTPFQGQFGTQQVYTSFAQLRKGPHETHAIQASMRVFKGVTFPSAAEPERGHPDLRPVAGSAVVNKGLRLYNVNDGFLGVAPDCGAYEAGQALPLYGPRPDGVDEGNPTPRRNTRALRHSEMLPKKSR